MSESCERDGSRAILDDWGLRLQGRLWDGRERVGVAIVQSLCCRLQRCCELGVRA